MKTLLELFHYKDWEIQYCLIFSGIALLEFAFVWVFPAIVHVIERNR